MTQLTPTLREIVARHLSERPHDPADAMRRAHLEIICQPGRIPEGRGVLWAQIERAANACRAVA